ncbi:undecaprenyl-diphosphate phosphatase [Niabella beijingensis]|uniref:undecaprenyl-diphosphate phosphatase n=1 Tax=Niabella beijingensis TaxID=2872700 RepID=UPI001CC194C4|nr:undecaprenyl-diphosphate phosphatase [Niabella beijingensis]MBZ4189600.1 undecaprenyl-diphosphate phosphatase [Niabella beijingensis]
MSIIQAIIIAIVEGITEYLPISSTGHMIIASSFMGIEKEEFTKLFEVSIQLGAILAVVVLYWRRFFPSKAEGGINWTFYLKLIAGVIPALVLGYLFSDKIDELLESPKVVAITLLAGGFVLLVIDRMFNHPTVKTIDQVSFSRAFVTGLWQVVAMVPGVSRSAASIIGGMQQKMTRNVAAEFSFFLAVPTMAAATLYSLFLKKWTQSGVTQKGYELILASKDNTIAFIVGNVVAFVVAILAIKFFIDFLKKYGFKAFGWYRIIAGAVLLILIYKGVIAG